MGQPTFDPWEIGLVLSSRTYRRPSGLLSCGRRAPNVARRALPAPDVLSGWRLVVRRRTGAVSKDRYKGILF